MDELAANGGHGLKRLLAGVGCGKRGGWGSLLAMDIELADAVAAVRDELLAAAGRATGAGVEFVVGPIALEFSVELRADAKAKAGFKAWVLSADAEAGASRGSTHRVTVELTPRRPGGGDLLVAGASGRADGPGDVSEHIGRQ